MATLPENTPRQRLAGIALMCGALLCFALLDACAKYLSPQIGALQVVWFRYAISAVAVAVLLNPLTAPGVWRTKKLSLQLARSLMLFLSTLFNFLALLELQLAQSMAIVFAVPLLVALLAGPLLGEWAGPRRIIAIIVGFLGVLVVTRPGVGGLPAAAWWSVAGVFVYALYNIITRMLAAHDSAQTTLVYSSVAGVAVLLPVLPFLDWKPMSLWQWSIACACALFGTFGHWLVIHASRRAPASVLTPFIYTQIVWMILLGYWIFGDLPDRYTLIGAGIVIASGLYLLYRERVRGADAARSMKSIP
ncbi:MAG: DMT family transporter [Beijerinckiaceae bacterium]